MCTPTPHQTKIGRRLTRTGLAIVPLLFVALALGHPHAAPAATFQACGYANVVTPGGFPITCPTLSDAIAAATANPGSDTIELVGGDYCPIALTGANGEISFIGQGFGASSIIPSGTTGFAAEVSTFTSRPSTCVDQGYLVKVDNYPFTITFENVAFKDETASGVGTGVLMNSGAFPAVGSLVLRDVIVQGNSVGVSFRGFRPSRFTMTGSTVTGNGNGVFLTGVDIASITNSTIADNTDRGLATGNLYSIELFNDTITRNFIGIQAMGSGNRVQMTNTIVSGNSAFDCSGADVFSQGHNVIGNFCGTPAVGDQTQTFLTLAPLADNFGNTPTILPPAAAVGHGTTGSCPVTDQRGFKRATTIPCDVGAVERDGIPPPNTPPTPNPLTLTFGAVTITFDSVLASGQTSVTTSSSGPAIPAGFTLNGSYYEVSTTSVFTTATLCITDPGVTASSRLLHYPGPADVTKLPVVPPKICSVSLNSFSPFAIVEPVSDTTPPSLSVSHAADGANGWNVTGPVAVAITAADAGSGLAGTPSCTDALNGGAPAALTVTGSAPSFAASAAGEGVHAISCAVSDVAGNAAASASDTVNLDTKAPVVSYTGNAGTYTSSQTINIACSAAEPTPGSGLASNTCVNIAEPASNFTVGSHALSADATDSAGNVGHGSTTFTVQAAPAPGAVTIGALCLMTNQFMQTSSRYLALGKWQKLVFDSLAKAVCQRLAVIGPHFTPKQKAAFVSAYKSDVQALVRLGWLTQPQATILIGLANQL